MKKGLFKIGLIIFVSIVSVSFLFSQEFYGYYTKINSGEPFEKISRTTEHADIKIKLSEPEGELVFWRGTSYLPYWKTEAGKWSVKEVIPREGDGTEKRPDKVNTFSRVRIIESTDEHVTVHWRYLPEFNAGNPKGGINHLNFVNEYYIIHKNGKVTRKIKEGTERIEEWKDESNYTKQTFQLASTGIKNVKTIQPSQSDPSSEKTIKGNPELGPVVGSPVLHFKFDDARGEETKESVSSEKFYIEGHKSYWRSGISVTALAFDGYKSSIRIYGEEAPSFSEFTIDAWVALGAYPWNWAPIVHQSSWEYEGYYLGVNSEGKIGFKLKSGAWEELTTTYEIPLKEWTHIAANYDGKQMKLFVNGKEIMAQKVSGNLKLGRSDFMIGRNNQPFRPYDPVRRFCIECHKPALFSIDGLIDEVKLYDKALSNREIAKSYRNFNPGEKIVKNPDMQERILPTGSNTGEFSARYTNLKYYDTWDNLARFGEHADVVVEFDELPTKFIFWRGMNYVPQVVNAENQWYNNQFNESWDANGSWGEPMSDKKSNISHVRIIENTPARKVIHWRYSQVQISGKQQNYDPVTGWGDWSDWYYYIYPDGVACKRMRHWSSDDPLNHEWQESIGVMNPGQTPEDISHVYDKTVTLADYNFSRTHNWSEGLPLESLEGTWVNRPLKVQIVNYKSEYDPFTIADFRGGECYGDFDEETAPYSKMVVYIHWPLGQLPTDGARAVKPDRGSSNGYTHLMFKGSHKLGQNWAERTMLEGMSSKSLDELRTIAKSWMQAPKASNINGAISNGYDQAQRAYVFSLKDSDMSFTLNGEKNSPIENPCFVIKDWGDHKKASLEINGKNISDGKDVRQGIVRDTDGTLKMVIYIDYSANSSTSFYIQK